jgi:hypothetical protein
MAEKLGDMLVRRGFITAPQLDEALKSQVIFGGRLGTNLIELGHIDEETLAQALAERFGVAAATPEQLLGLTPEVTELLPREIVERYKVVPVELDKKRLTVAMSDPSDLAVLDELAFRTGFIIRPLVTPEVRLVAALEKYYGIKREFRYINVTRKGRSSKAPLAGTVVPAEHLQAEMIDFSVLPETMVEPEPLEELEEIPAVEPAPAPVQPPPAPLAPQPPQPAPAAAPAPQQPTPLQPAPQAPPQEAAPQPYTLENLSLDLADAADRDEIASYVVNFLGQEYERVAFFLLRGNKAQGWRGVIRKKAIPHFEAAEFPLQPGSVLSIVSEGKSFYLGPIAAVAANGPMLESLGGGGGRPACLVPLLMVGKVVAVLFVDDGRKGMNEALPELQQLMAKASMAFEILILRNKILYV